MSRLRRRREHRDATAFVALDRSRCEACWACLEACPLEVFGKVDFLGHRHAKIRNAGVCTGCGRCVQACEAGALTRLPAAALKRHTDAAPQPEAVAALPSATTTAPAPAPTTAPAPDPALPPA